jgi:hypothetical protein
VPTPALPPALTPDPLALARRLLEPFGEGAARALAELTPAQTRAAGPEARL